MPPLLLLLVGVEVKVKVEVEDPGLALMQPGAVLAVADLTVMAPALVGGREPTEGGDLTSAAAGGVCGGTSDNTGGRERGGGV